MGKVIEKRPDGTVDVAVKAAAAADLAVGDIKAGRQEALLDKAE